MVTLRFLRQHGPYQPGDVAGFPSARARTLVAAGVAAPAELPGARPEQSAGDRRTEPARRRRRSPVVTKEEPVATKEEPAPTKDDED
jgi:hypothetical protein